MPLAKRKPSKGKARKTLAVPQRPTIPVGALFRMFVLGSVAIIASSYAIWRYYTVPYRPMLEPKPAASEVEIEWQPVPSASAP